MKQIIIISILVFIIIGLLLMIMFGSKGKKSEPQNTLIFFYGNTCSHCENVEEWMEENQVEEKVKIVKKIERREE